MFFEKNNNKPKIAVITGATSGIGNSVLRLFLDNGYTVYAGYRDIRQKKLLSILSDNVIPFRIDLSKKWTIDEAINFINESIDKIDVLVNAAGKVVAGPLETLPVSKIREQFEVNTFSHLEFSQGLFEKLEGGKIINISSMSSYGMFPFLAPYCASKKALDMLFNSLRIETGSKVKIISVKPGVIATPLWKKSIDENRENIGTGKYKVVGDYLIANAIKNSQNGLDVKKVAEKVLKIAESKNPKSSYVIGSDAQMVRMVAKLPQQILDRLVENQLVKRIKEQLSEVLLIHGDERFINKKSSESDLENDEQDNYKPATKTWEDVKSEVRNREEQKMNLSETEDFSDDSEDAIPSALEEAIESNKSKSDRKKENNT